MIQLHREAIKVLQDIELCKDKIQPLDNWMYNHSGNDTDMIKEVGEELKVLNYELEEFELRYETIKAEINGL